MEFTGEELKVLVKGFIENFDIGEIVRCGVDDVCDGTPLEDLREHYLSMKDLQLYAKLKDKTPENLVQEILDDIDCETSVN